MSGHTAHNLHWSCFTVLMTQKNFIMRCTLNLCSENKNSLNASMSNTDTFMKMNMIFAVEWIIYRVHIFIRSSNDDSFHIFQITNKFVPWFKHKNITLHESLWQGNIGSVSNILVEFEHHLHIYKSYNCRN